MQNHLYSFVQNTGDPSKEEQAHQWETATARKWQIWVCAIYRKCLIVAVKCFVVKCCRIFIAARMWLKRLIFS
jgi:hypothetical protein